jgi:hypothetical protein
MISQRHALQKPHRLLTDSSDTSTETQSLKRLSREERKERMVGQSDLITPRIEFHALFLLCTVLYLLPNVVLKSTMKYIASGIRSCTLRSLWN